MSLEITSGGMPCASIASAVSNENELVLGIDHPVFGAREAVRQDIARLHVADDLLEPGRRRADVHHQRQPDSIGELAGALQRLDARAAGGVPIDTRLDAEDDVAVLV